MTGFAAALTGKKLPAILNKATSTEKIKNLLVFIFSSTNFYVFLRNKKYFSAFHRLFQTAHYCKGLQGTWMDEKLALKFAAWLSPRFELWVYDRIQELITTGETRLKGIPPSGFAATLRLLAEQWEKQERINEDVREELHKTAQRLDELESKIISVDDHYYTIAGYCNLKKIPCPLHLAKEWGKTAAALSRQKSIPTGTAHDERYGQVRTYHEDVLQEVIG